MDAEGAAHRNDDLHALAQERLRRSGQRYTANRRALVDALSEASKPLTVIELLEYATSVVQSSAYRNLAVLERAAVVERVVTTDDFSRYELAHDLTAHHHHMVCTHCGDVIDFELPASIEAQLDEVLMEAARAGRFEAEGHTLDVLGTCARCPDPRGVSRSG